MVHPSGPCPSGLRRVQRRGISAVSDSSPVTVWVFLGDGARWPSGVFQTRERAESWIKVGELTGMLTEYPLDADVSTTGR
ncbi:DUF7710 domain-containing protein [Streptosporangium sandarakinum]|uniref:DUF7710 domain-containing protein n=1 Tax=Streptosporangium sandarakinum TaxID=1260955 RepID=UPI00406CCE18